jgi:hypothetical protein
VIFANAVAGDYLGKNNICIGVLWSGPKAEKFDGIDFMVAKFTGLASGVKYAPYQLKRVIQLSSESSVSGSAMTGLAGGLLFGGAGLIAGALAGGRKSILKIGIEFDDGRKVVLEQTPDNKALQCLLLFAREKGILEQQLGF